MKNHSASPMSAEGCISPAFTDFSPDEIIATAKQDRSAARRTIGQRFGPLLYWLAAFFAVAGPVLGASQADLQPALAQFSQEGSKLVGTFAVGLGRARLVRRAFCRRQHRHRGRACRQQDHGGGVGLYPQQWCLDPAEQQAGRHRRGWKRRTRLVRRAVRRRQHRHRGRAF